MTGFRRLVHEVHRRSLWQVLGVYLAASWVALQVVETLTDGMGLPDWVMPFALVLLVIGLPIVLATAFIQEGVGAGRPADEGVAEARDAVGEPADAADEAPHSPAGTLTGVTGGAERASHHRVFTWRNALLGGGAAFALLGLAAAGYMTMRALGIGPAGTLQAKGMLEERTRVVLTDFEAADPELAAAATEALRVDLSQSPALHLLEERRVAEALERMGRDPGEPLRLDVARELAEREGVAAILAGEANRAGAGYVFAVRIVSAEDGAVLTSQRVTAEDETEVVAAIDALSKKLRERVGESLRSIRADPPLERVTTSNLEALRLYSRAKDAPGGQRVSLLEQAIALDSGFAMAWRNLGIIWRNRQAQRSRAVEGFTRAFEHRDRLTERERRLTAADYYLNVTFEPAKAIPEYEALISRDSLDLAATVNLGVVYGQLRESERGAEQAERAIAIDPDRTVGYWNAITSWVNAGRLEDARRVLAVAEERFPEWARYASIMVLQAEGNLEEVERRYREFAAEPDLPPPGRAGITADLASVLGARGRLAEARERLRVAAAAWEEVGPQAGAEYLEEAIAAAWLEIAVAERPEEGVRRLDSALTRFPLEEIPPLDRPYGALAEAYARAGRAALAGALLDELAAELPASVLGGMESDLARARAEVALAEGRVEEAIAGFRRADAGSCTICALPGLALAYERAGAADSAIAVHRRYVETPFSDRFYPYTYALGPLLGPTHERLGQLYEEAGELESAATHYARFVELWADADEELQPRVEAAQARLEEIVAERG